MIKKFLTYTLSLIILAGCSDPLEFYPDNTISPDGDIQFTLDIPRMTIPTSRSTSEIDPEYHIENISVIIYKGEGESNLPSQTEYFFSQGPNSPSENNFEMLEGENKFRLSFRLDESLRRTSGLRFYFLANSPERDFSISESDLKSQLVDHVKIEKADGSLQSLVMCGSVRQADLSTTQYVSMYRNTAKVTVSNVIPTNNPDGLAFYTHSLYGNASTSPRMAYMKEENTVAAQEIVPDDENVSLSDVSFLHPTQNSIQNNGIGGKLFLITKATFNGKDYFYRLDFVGKDIDGKDSYINVRPNHWYQFVILEILSPGYDTPSEAALHPYNGIKYEIHDHSPVSYNMTSDGFRELGVSHIIEYSGLHNAENSWSEKELYVKLFSKDAAEVPNGEKIADFISIKDPSWLQISEAEMVTEDAFTGGVGTGSDLNDTGTVYRFKLRFRQTDELGSLENLITVRWMGLQREVPVIWTRNFSGSDVTSASLKMEYAGSTTQIEDYWNFLTSTDEPSGEVSNALWGIQTEANNGKTRNQGFHFPVMYGNSGNLATYSYVLTFDKLDKLKKDNVAEVVVNTTESHVSWVENSDSEFYSFIISRDNNDGYNYSVGDISFTFHFKDGSAQSYNFRLYHTGFFHKDNQSHRLDDKDTKNYYYYEVVPVMVDGQERYMLDRNLAAKSAEMYVRDESGNTTLGNPEAAGGYYTVAFQQLDEYDNNTYNDPVLFDDTDDRVSPPGYRIPMKNAWGAIRTSPNFHNEAVNGVFPAYYDTGNPQIGKVYFPKSMLFIYDSGGSGNIKGDARSGYYWTGTAATGTEKDEIGKWLNMFMLTGSSTSYVNGCVVTNVPNLEYGASVRCINDVPDTSTTNLTSFNVTGATHVFLYKEDSNGVRTATTAWPGHSIGNYATMTDGRWFGFSFESTQFSPEELYVIFNFVDQDGIIYTYSCKQSDGSTILTTHLTPSECVGWKVIGDTNGSIVPADNFTTIDHIVLMPAAKTALKNWWRCGGRKSGNPYVFDYKLAPKTLYMIGDATPGKWDYNSLTAIDPNIINGYTYTWEGELTKGELKATFSTLRDDSFWSAYFFRPIINQTQISEAGLTNSPMGEWKEDKKNGKEDNKWKVVTPGKYRLSFNMNDMTFSAYCLEVTPEGTIKITVTNDQGWEDVYLYYWNSAGNYGNSWPGTKMQPVPGTVDQFYLEIPEFSEYIIFHNNKGIQTGDIPLNGNYNFDRIPLS